MRVYILNSLDVTMSSKKFNHFHNIKEIQLSDTLILFFCEYCHCLSINCFVMKSWFKCDKCTQCDHFCVTVSWESLNKTHIQLQKNISHTNTELGVLAAKIVWLQKTLDQVNHCTSEKTNCLVTELDSDNDEMKNENNFSDIQQLVDSMSFSFWNSVLFSSQNVEVFLHSSWDSSWVLRYFQKCCTSFTL